MDASMGPPPPRNPNRLPDSEALPEQHAPPPPVEEQSDTPAPDDSRGPTESADGENPRPDSEAPEKAQQQQRRPPVPYSTPPWSAPPQHPFFIEVIKDGAVVEKLDVSEKGAYMFGRVELCDFLLEHPTISRFHAVLQFNDEGEAFLYDLGSTHGTFVNKNQIKKQVYTKISVGAVIRFGQSSRLYIFQGPEELMPPEGDMQKLREKKARQEIRDREASLLRAKNEAALADGISWGFDEDAVEENPEEEEDEVTWQNYKGQLTERQEKTRSKIIKRMEKVANMKKEIEAIRAKDIAQGGLTQGQQTQIGRNEMRISQILEELENLEETLNDSICESVGARAPKNEHKRKKGVVEEDEDMPSDDDDFYDRTKKKPNIQKSGDHQSVKTAYTLLDERDSIASNVESKKKMLEEEKAKLSASDKANDADDLVAYMTGLSSQLVQDNVRRIEREIADLYAELDKVSYLLKIADPTGEAAQKRECKAQNSVFAVVGNPVMAKDSLVEGICKPHDLKVVATMKLSPTKKDQLSTSKASTEGKPKESSQVKDDLKDGGQDKPSFALPKPHWLGAVRNVEPSTIEVKEVATNSEEPDNFVDYKDRKTALCQPNSLKEAGPGLIIRKPKQPHREDEFEPQSSTPESSVADDVALLLKYTHGYHCTDDAEDGKGSQQKPKRVLGPAKPEFLDTKPDYESWVPPEGQTGDGRTALNDRLGY